MAKSDIELWQEVLAENSSAWAELVKRYQSLVYTVATRAGLSMSDAADCFQQTWVLLYQNRKKVNDPSRISAWLVTTAKREALRLRQRAGPDVGDPEEMNIVDPAPLPDEELSRLELQAQLESALGEIDIRCRKLITAFFFEPEDTSYEQIAKQLGLAMNSLGPIRRRCLERLKQILIRRGYPAVRNDKLESL